MHVEIGNRMRAALAAIVCVLMLNGMPLLLAEDAAAFPDTAWISGTVTDGSGPVPNAYVKTMLFMADNEEINYTFTESGGNYTMGVPGGLEFMVLAADGNHYMSMNVVKVLPGQTKYVNFTLRPIAPVGTNVTLKGYVLDEFGAPVAGGHAIGFSLDPGGGDMPNFANLTTPDGTGYFELNVIASPVGGGVISFDFPGYPSSENSTNAPIVDGMTYWFNLTLKPKVYNDDAVVYGYVTDIDTGDPLPAAIISIESRNPYNDPYGGYSNYTLSNETGYFEMRVQNGSGDLTVRKLGYSMKQIRLDISEGASVRQDFQLVKGVAVIRGNVTDMLSGAPISFARVFLFDTPSDPWSGNVSMVVTNDSGFYELEAFAGIDLVLGAQQDGYSQEFLTLNVSSGDEIWQDFGLWPASAIIEGYVTDAVSGLPLADVWVRLSSDRYETNVHVDSFGYYNSPVVPGDYLVEAWAPDHWPYYGAAVATEGNTTVHDISLMPWMSAELVGTVTDLIEGTPIPGANLWVWSMFFGNSTTANATGEYSMRLVAGLYQVYAFAPGYFDHWGEVMVDNLTTVVYDIAMTPMSPATNTRLYGYVYDDSTMAPIQNAHIRINLPDRTYRNETSTDFTGWYEIYVPSWELDLASWASGYAPQFLSLNLTGQAEFNLDIYLTADVLRPNLTFSAAPSENISSVNPCMIDIALQEENLLSMYLFTMMHWNTTAGGSNYSVIMFNATNLDPLNAFDSLGYSLSGDNYTVHIEWPAMIQGGWLENSSERVYMPSNTGWNGSERVNELRGLYSNGTVSGMTGSALFNLSTGAYLGFRMDMGPVVDAADPSGVFEPQGTVAEFTGAAWPTMLEQRTLGSWGVSDLNFVSDLLVPSGDYKTLFWAVDWGDMGDATIVNLTVDNDEPVADAGADLSGVENTIFELNASMSWDNVGIVSYVWEFVDGYGAPVVLSSSTPVVGHVFNMSGVYNVTLTVADAAGHEVTDMLVVTVLQDMPPTAAAGPDQTVDEDILVQFDGSGSSDDLGIVNITWDVDELGVHMYGFMPTYTFASPGIYEVNLTVTDTIGQLGTDQVVITVIDTTDPFADAGPDDTILVGTSYVLNGSSSYDNVLIVNYTWTFTDVTPQTLYGETPAYVFAHLGVLTITLTVTDGEGLTDTDTVVITTIDDVDPVAAAGADRSIRVGSSTTLDASSSTDNVGITSYTWTFMDVTPQTLTGVTQSYTFTHTGLFNITLNVTDASGNYDLDWLEITVYDDVPPTASAGPDRTVNITSSVTLDGSLSTDNYGVASYTWSFHDVTGQNLTGASPVYQFNHPGVFNITLNVTDASGNWDLDWVQITVEDNIPPVAQASVSQASITAGMQVSFNSAGSTDNVGIVNYTWVFVDISTKTLYGSAPTYVFNNDGVFVVTLTVRDAAGLSDTDTVTVAVAAVNEPPSANAGPDQTVTVGARVVFDGSESDDDAGTADLNYTWEFIYDGRTVLIYGVDPTFDFDIAGTYTVTLTVWDIDGEPDTDTVRIVVEESAQSFVEQYWWVLLVIVVVVVLVVAFFVMRRGKGPALEGSEPSPPEPPEEPGPPEDDEL